MLSAADERELLKLSRRMNQILERSGGWPGFYQEPPKYKYTKEEGIRLRIAMERRLIEILDSGVKPTRIEISRHTEWLFGLDTWGQDKIYVPGKKPIYSDDPPYPITYNYAFVDVKVRRDIYIPEAVYYVYAGDERVY